jgi:hypothetical protein
MPSGSKYTSAAIQASKPVSADQQDTGFGRIVHFEECPVSIKALVERIRKNAGLEHGE